MLKNILNLEGAQQLSKNEQQSINGGGHNCQGSLSGLENGTICNGLGWVCCNDVCVPDLNHPDCIRLG